MCIGIVYNGTVQVHQKEARMYAEQPTQDEINRMTVEEYLAFADANEGKYEYAGGKVLAMGGGSLRHATITANVITQLNVQLAERDCTVTSPDMRVQILKHGNYRYPDVSVFCGEPVYHEGRTDTLTNPALVVEVLSPATMLTDREDKLEEYTSIPGLGAYLLVAQDEMRAERYLRRDDGQWLYTWASGEDGVHPGPRRLDGRRRPDARRGAGDDDHVVAEISTHTPQCRFSRRPVQGASGQGR